MPSIEPCQPPIDLTVSLHSVTKVQNNAQLGCEIKNLSKSVLSKVVISFNTSSTRYQDVEGLDSTEYEALGSGREITACIPYKALEEGEYALTVQVEVFRKTHNTEPEIWESNNSLTFYATGRNQEVVVRDVIIYKSPVPVKLNNENTSATKKTHCMHLVIKKLPGLNSTSIDFIKFVKYWKDIDKPELEEFGFVSEKDILVTKSITVGESYQLKINSSRGGYITLIGQNSSGEFFQLSPHSHYGQPMVAVGSIVLLTDIIKNYTIRVNGQSPDPNLQASFKFRRPGLEQVLALVHKIETIHEPVRFEGPDYQPPKLDNSAVVNLLKNAFQRGDIELGYASINVREVRSPAPTVELPPPLGDESVPDQTPVQPELPHEYKNDLVLLKSGCYILNRYIKNEEICVNGVYPDCLSSYASNKVKNFFAINSSRFSNWRFRLPTLDEVNSPEGMPSDGRKKEAISPGDHWACPEINSFYFLKPRKTKNVFFRFVVELKKISSTGNDEVFFNE